MTLASIHTLPHLRTPPDGPGDIQDMGLCHQSAIKEFGNVAREATRKRCEKFIMIKVVPAHGELVEQVRHLRGVEEAV
jgi:hypothetical protein